LVVLVHVPLTPQVHSLSPTRRSSDLGGVCGFADTLSGVTPCILSQLGHFSRAKQKKVFNENNPGTLKKALPSFGSLIDSDCWARSEEHTSELQSRFDLVCRLLLEKKK